MKRLKNKVFFVIVGILSIFLISILAIFNIQDYTREKNNIESNLMRAYMPSPEISKDSKEKLRQPKDLEKDNIMPKEDFKEYDLLKQDEMKRRIFMDYEVYIVSFNDEKEVESVSNHAPDIITTEKSKEIEKEAEKIINNNNRKDLYIGNLYVARYSYLYKDSKVVIIENTRAKQRIMQTLKTSIVVFIILGVMIILIAIKLTNWIIKPVVSTFNKQKQFIADASHELKTPLAVIMASTEVLEKETTQNKWLDNIKEEATRMNDLICELLDLAKTESVDIQLQNENISKIIEKSILTFESLMYEKDIELDYNIENNIYMSCNGVQLKQLLGILIDNAIKHCDTNGKIQISLKKNKTNIILKVKNNGKEIPKDEREKIFERFYKGDQSRNRDDNRYGLGLAIAKNIVENHGGNILIDCKDGFTIFKITFMIAIRSK